MIWQKGLHHVRFGEDWETSRGGRTSLSDEPVTLQLFAPTSVRDFNVPSTSRFSDSLAGDIPRRCPIFLQLPLQNFTVGIGNPFVPQAGFGRARVSPLVHLFFQDTWHVHPRFVVDYGLGWTYDAPLNYDLPKPATWRRC